MFPNDITPMIAAILFVLLIIAFPIIGVFSGWKRAAYWGGANLVFYIIGALIYRFAGGNIATSLAPKFIDIFKAWGFKGDITVAEVMPFVRSIIGPLLFLIVFIAGNIILIINYYAWFKRLVGISREAYAKKLLKQARKQNKAVKLDKKDKKVLKYKLTKEDLVRVSSSKYKTLNRTVGCFGLWFAMIPSTIALSQATIYATSNTATREQNGIGYAAYTILNGVNAKAPWFSFYSGNPVGEDYDSLMSLLRLGNNLSPQWLEDGKYMIIDAVSGKKIEAKTYGTNSIAVFNTVIGKAIGNLFQTIAEFNAVPAGQEESLGQKAEAIKNACEHCQQAWYQMYIALNYDIQGLYGSANIMILIPKLITSGKNTINKQSIELLTDYDTIESVTSGLINGGDIVIRGITIPSLTSMNRIELKQNICESTLKTVLMNFYTYDSDVTESLKAEFEYAMGLFLSMFYNFIPQE